MNTTKQTIEATPTKPWRTKSGVVVGALYRAQPKPHHDRDALRLQAALLGLPDDRIDWDGIAIVAVCGILAAAALVAFWVK